QVDDDGAGQRHGTRGNVAHARAQLVTEAIGDAVSLGFVNLHEHGFLALIGDRPPRVNVDTIEQSGVIEIAFGGQLPTLAEEIPGPDLRDQINVGFVGVVVSKVEDARDVGTRSFLYFINDVNATGILGPGRDLGVKARIEVAKVKIVGDNVVAVL